MKKHAPQKTGRLWLVLTGACILIPLLFGSLLGTMHLQLLQAPYDFRIYYAAAKVWLQGQNPYDALNLQHMYNTIPNPGFVYPLWCLFLFAPLVFLPLNDAAGIWFIANLEFLILSIVILYRNLPFTSKYAPIFLFLAGTLSIQGLFVLIQGQISFFLLFLIASAYWLLLKSKGQMAGAVLALSMIKPQLCWLPAVALLFMAWRNGFIKPVLQGFFGSFILLVAGSFLAFPGWFNSWLNSLHADAVSTAANGQNYADNMGTIYAIARHIPYIWLGICLLLAVFSVLIFLSFKAVKDREPGIYILAAACAVVGIVSPWMWIYDGIIWMIPLAYLAACRSRWSAAAAWIVFWLVPYMIRVAYLALEHTSAIPLNNVADIAVPILLLLLITYSDRRVFTADFNPSSFPA